MSLFGKSQPEPPLIGARIEDYALIGDTETAGLVCKDGSLDWLCWPVFSSGAVFAGLLGTRDHGYYKIHPAADEAIVANSWRYLPHTLVVEKTWTTLDGEVTVTDFMPPRGKNSDVVRIVKGVRGTVKMRMDMTLRFDYGCTVPWVEHVDHHMRAIAGPHLVVLRTEAELRGEDMKTVSDFAVTEGESTCFVLSYGSSMEDDPESFDAYDALRDTEQYWTEWAAQGTYDGKPKWHEAVERSLITLKALTYKPSGGLVAAPTTSLPERIGGERNWDYRYCWLRDTSWTLLALLYFGYTEEALAWRGWLLRAASGAPKQLRAVYGLNGERLLNEWKVEWLPGYENSKPVLVGNGASDQVQLDIFGEIIAALVNTPVGADDMWSHSVRNLASGLLDYLATIWRDPDSGIWEVRGGPEALYAFQAGGVDGVRPGDQVVRRTRGQPYGGAGRARGALAQGAQRCSRRPAGEGLRYEAEQLCAELRFEKHRRVVAADCAGWVSAGGRPTDAGDAEGRGGTADAGRPRSALRHSGRGRRFDRDGGRVSGVFVLVCVGVAPSRAGG